jgi:hypothetical protein
VSREIDRSAARHQKLILALMTVATDEQKARVAAIINEPREDSNR